METNFDKNFNTNWGFQSWAEDWSVKWSKKGEGDEQGGGQKEGETLLLIYDLDGQDAAADDGDGDGAGGFKIRKAGINQKMWETYVFWLEMWKVQWAAK